MTDTTPEQTNEDEQGWGDAKPAPATFPEYGPLPEARISLNFTPGKPPQLTVRAHTAAELTAALQELEEGNVYNVIGVAHASLGAQVAIGAGLGPATQVPSAPGPAQAVAAAYPTPAPVPPPVPGVPGQAPAAWQNAGAPAVPPPPAPPAPPAVQNTEYRNAGWYRLDVPFKPQGGNPGKPKFDEICAQYQMQKGRPSEGGSYSFNNKGEKAWYVSPQYVSIFPMFSPLPA